MNQLLEAALEYAEAGIPVFPCKQDKTPYTKRGFYDACKDPVQIKKWWLRWPNANIGIPTGEVSGVWVLDVDNKNGVYGDDSLVKIMNGHKMPDTAQARTPNDGDHIYFLWQSKIKSSAGKLGKGLDIRAEAAYVIAPPSMINGKRYFWQEYEGKGIPDLAPAPDWLLSLVEAPAPRSEINVEGLLTPGRRNNDLTSLAGAARRQGYTPEQVLASLRGLNMTSPDPVEDKELVGIANQSAKWEAGPAEEAKVVSVTNPDNPTITIRAGALHETLNMAEKVLVESGSNLYQRGSMFVSHSKLTESQDGKIERSEGASVIRQVDEYYIAELLGQYANWERCIKVDKNGEPVISKVDCPKSISKHLTKRPDSRLPYLAGVKHAPTLRHDGSILQKEGYDPGTGLLMDYKGQKFPPIPENPSMEDAIKAIEILMHPFRLFPFVDDYSKAVVASAVLTGVIRNSLRSAPMHGIDATTPSTGKSLVCDAISMIITGTTATVMSYVEDPSEERKRIMSLLVEGDPIIVVDNIDKPWGSASMCSVLTQSHYKDRILGSTQIVSAPTTALWLANGNNLRFAGDLSTRVIISRMDAKMESPEERAFDVDLRKWIPEHRGELVVAALTILRAYHVAGRPNQDVPQFGRFEEWSDLVRSSLLWVGMDDPCSSRQTIKDSDPEIERLGSILEEWYRKFQNSNRTINEVFQLADEDLGATIEEHFPGKDKIVGGDRGGRSANKRSLGRWIASNEGRILDGKKFVRAGTHHRAVKWRVIAM